MAQTIAKMNIHLGAQTTALEQGLKRAQGSVANFGSLATKALGAMGIAVGAVEAIRGVKRLGEAVQEFHA